MINRTKTVFKKKLETVYCKYRTYQCLCPHYWCYGPIAHITRDISNVRWHRKIYTTIGLLLFKRNPHCLRYAITKDPLAKGRGGRTEKTIKFDIRYLEHLQKTNKFQPNSSVIILQNAILMIFLDERKIWTFETYTVYIGVEKSCYMYIFYDGSSHTQKYKELSANEEVDSRIMFHADFIWKIRKDVSHAVIGRSCDTDVFILLLYHQMHLNVILQVDTDNSSRNSRRMINI